MHYVISLVVLAMIGLVVHEIAHALAMKKLGIPVQEAGLGIPVDLQLTIAGKRIRISLPKLAAMRLKNGLTLSIHPLMLGAFVQESEEGSKRLEELPYREKAFVYGAGAASNLWLGMLMWFITLGALVSAGAMTTNPGAVIVMASVGFSVILLSRYIVSISAYIVPFLGFYMLEILFLSWLANDSITALLMAPLVTMIHMMGAIQLNEVAKLIMGIGFLGTVINFSLALFNALPLMPLDGGHIAEAILKQCGVPDKALGLFARHSQFIFVAVSIIFVMHEFAHQPIH